MRNFFAKYQIDEPVIAAAVSGGADSLALALRLKESGKKVVALTVDHGLRPQSRQEALYVADIMRRHDIEHHILIWDGVKPTAGIEEAARQARYKLLFDFCREHRISVLATGHHRRDQAETFLLRLQRGSGVYGLSAILPVSRRDEITLIRPLLDVSPDDLRADLTRRNIRWIEDPMNDQDDFLRVKIRKFLPLLAEIGIDEKRLADTAATLAQTRNFLQTQVDAFIGSHVRFFNDCAAALSLKKLISLPPEIATLVLAQLIQKTGGGFYAPEAGEVHRILREGADFRGCTLGKCELFMAAKRLWIVPEDTSGRIMPRQDWEQLALRLPQYRNAGLPYKVRRALWNKLKD